MLGVWPPGALLATLFFFNNAYGPYKVPSPDIHSYTIILTSFIIMAPTVSMSWCGISACSCVRNGSVDLLGAPS